MATPSNIPNPYPIVRRVVTGHNAEGVSMIRSDGLLTNIKDEAAFEGRSQVAWITDATPAPDNNCDMDGADKHVPGLGLVSKGGTNFRYTDFAPGAVAAMHRTASVDYNIILHGDIVLRMEDGDERLMHAGDIVLQRGTLHGWWNPSSDKWVRMLSVLIDADPAVVSGQVLHEEWRGEVQMGE